jgi:hypothetical protein
LAMGGGDFSRFLLSWTILILLCFEAPFGGELTLRSQGLDCFFAARRGRILDLGRQRTGSFHTIDRVSGKEYCACSTVLPARGFSIQ